MVVLLLLLTALLSCDKNTEPEPQSPLAQTGILGKWEIESYAVNGIVNMAIYCCEFVEFLEDERPDDLHGRYLSYGSGTESEGRFTIDPVSLKLVLDSSKETRNFEYQLQESRLTVTYMENDDMISISYIKRN